MIPKDFAIAQDAPAGGFQRIDGGETVGGGAEQAVGLIDLAAQQGDVRLRFKKLGVGLNRRTHDFLSMDFTSVFQKPVCFIIFVVFCRMERCRMDVVNPVREPF